MATSHKQQIDLSEIFAIDVAAYAVMSNYYHVVWVDQNMAEGWTTTEVIKGWSTFFLCQ